MKATLKRHKKITVIIGAVIILLMLLGILAYNDAVNEMQLIHSSMSSTMATFENKYKRAESILEISDEINKEMIEGTAYLNSMAFDRAQDAQTALDILYRDYYDCYLIDESGSILTAKATAPLSLSDKQQEQLSKDGSLTVKSDKSTLVYNIVTIPQGRLITCYKNAVSDGDGMSSAFTGIADRFDYYIADASDGKIRICSDEKMTGTMVAENLKAPFIGTAQDYRTKISDARYGFTKLGIGKAYCFEYEKDGSVFGLYYQISNIIRDVLEEMVTPLIIIAGSFAVILAFFFVLWRNPEEKGQKWRRLFRSKAYFDSTKVTHLAGFVLFTLIIVLIFTAHFFIFSSYSMQSQLSTENLDMLSANIKSCEKDMQCIDDTVEKYSEMISERICDLLSIDPALAEHDQLADIADNSFLSEISIYNGSGVQEASSGAYIGYTLTQNEKDPMFAARSVLTDDVKMVFKKYDDETGRYLLAQKRRDVPGVICIKYENAKLSQMLQYYSKENAIRNTDFGDITAFFVRVGEGEKTYIIAPYDNEIHIADFELPEELKKDKYSGTCKLNGVNAYVNTSVSENIAVVSAIDCDQLNADIWLVLLTVVFGFVLLMVLVFYGCVCHPDLIEEEVKADSTQEEEQVKNKRDIKLIFQDSCFRKMIRYELIVLVIGYCFMMFKRTTGHQTLLTFIFNGKWDKGFNLFAYNAGIIVAVMTIGALFLIRMLLMFFGKIIGAKGLSICNIVVSVLKFFGLFFIIGHTLYQLGVNIGTLLAGAGLAGLIIGIAAKDIFTDLIAGLFLIFEGNIRVGDFVECKNFRGEIVEIGARVTVIQRFHRKFIINNSDIKQFLRLSDELGGAWVEIGVGPNEDIGRIKQLIEDSKEWYQSMIPALKEGPFFLNVTDFNASGITIALFGLCTDERSGSTKRKIMYYTIELFREHGITLARQSIKVEVDASSFDDPVL